MREVKMKKCRSTLAVLVLFTWSAALWLPVRSNTNTDTDALWDFYNHIEEPRGILANWNLDTSPCNWAGLQCDDVGNVIFLELRAKDLRGTIPESIGNITNLLVLDLSQNFFIGAIPGSISKLPKLANFTAAHNNLSQSIPDDLGSSGNLANVDLSDNLLSGTIPTAICQSPGLKVLTLNNNILTGSIPSSMSDCQSLERLFLGSNQLGGTIPALIGTLKRLVSLDLSRNNFNGNLPLRFVQTNLTYLWLHGNRLQGNISTQLGDLASLTLLSLAGNNLQGSIPPELGKLGALGQLLLKDNKITGSIPNTLGDISTLAVLDLSWNELTEEIPAGLGKLAKLQTLTLRGNSLSGTIPSSLQGCVSLLDLDLSMNKLTGQVPPEIGSISLLTYGLNLSRNSLTGLIPEELGQLQKLEFLDLSHNQLEGKVPTALGNLRSLLSINLADNKLNGSLPTFRAGMVNASQVGGNRGLCGAPLAPCDKSGNAPVLEEHQSIRIWVAIISGVCVALVLIIIGGVVLCSWRLRCRSPREIEPKVSSAEGRLFVDNEKPFAFSFEEVVEATRLISEATPIGKGRFSTVYKIVLSSSKEIAVKMLKVDTENSSFARMFTSELLKIDKIQHRNLLRLLGYVLQGESLLLFYDFCPNGSLGEWLHRKTESVLEWRTRYKIAVGAAQGLAFLHHSVHPPFIHRDVSTNNIFLDASFEALLGDVGLAKFYDPSKQTETDSMTAVAGSFGYIAPEYAYTMRVTEKSNVYSFGVVLLEILSGKQPVESTFGEGCDLVSWVHSAPQRNEMPEQLLDASVSTASFRVRQEMLSFLRVAKLCTSAQPSERPRMKAVVEMLQRSNHSGMHPFSSR